MIGDFLYMLSPSEERSAAVLQRQIIFATVTTAAGSVTTPTSSAEQKRISVPSDKYLWLLNAVAFAVSGAAQNCTNLTLRVLDQINGLNVSILAGVNTISTPRVVVHLLNPVLMSPSESLQAVGTFDGGVDANQVFIHAQGLLIPKGNLQLR